MADIVRGCPDTDVLPKPPWQERKKAYLKALRRKSDRGALRVVTADKLHNAEAILRDLEGKGESLWERFNAGKHKILWYYGSLANILVEREGGPLSRELARVVARLEEKARSDGA